jgi:hypothetical protein
MRILLFFLLIFLLGGCVNKEGISLKYYDNCHPEYDYYGTYHYVCPDNIVNFKNKKNDSPKDCLQCN